MKLRSRPRAVTSVVALAAVAAIGSVPAAASTTPDPPDTSEPTTATTGVAVDLAALDPKPLAETTDVTISVSGSVASFLPILIAQSSGEFERENLNVEIEIIPATEGTLLVAQGELDAAAVAVNAGNMNLIGTGQPLRFAFPYEPEFAPETRGSGVWVRKDVIGDDGFQPDDLRGVPIASSTGIASGTLGYFYLNFLNVDGDFPISDLNAQQFANPDTPEALANGGLGAGIVFAPFQRVVEESGCCEYIENSDPSFPFGWFIIGQRFYEDERDVGVAFFRAIARTAATQLQGDYIDDPVVGPLIAEALEQPLEDLQAQDQAVWDPTFPIDPEGVLATLDYWREIPGVLEFDNELDVDAVFDLDMYNQALGRD